MLAREHNDANVVSVGGRMHTLDEMTRFVEVFLGTAFSGEERHVRRIGQLGDVRDHRRAAAAARSPRSAAHARGRARCLRVTPSAGSPTDLGAAFAGRPVRVSSPQGRFAADAAVLDGPTLVGAESAGKHLFVEFDGERLVHVHLGLIGKFDVHAGVAAVPPPVGQVRLRLVSAGRPTADASYADLRGATQCDLVGPERRDAGPRRARPGPAACRRRPRAGLAADPAQPPPDRRPADGPGGAGRRRQRLPRRGALPAADPPAATRRTRCGCGQWRAIWDDLVELMAEGVATRPDRHRAARAHARGDGSGRRAPTTTAGRSTSTAGPASRAWCAADRCAPRCWPGATCSGVRVVSPGSAPRAVQ